MAELAYTFAPGLDCGFSVEGLSCTPLPDQGFVSVQLSKHDVSATNALATALGALPSQVGEITQGDTPIAKTGPFAFMALPTRTKAPDLAASIEAKAQNEGALRVVDVSHRGAAFKVEGEYATEAVARTIELAAASVPVGHCARTMWNRNAILVLRDAQQSWRLVVDISLGWALADWMARLSQSRLD